MKDKGTYVVVRRYKLDNLFRGSGSQWCSHAILSRKLKANGWLHGVVCSVTASLQSRGGWLSASGYRGMLPFDPLYATLILGFDKSMG